MPRKLIPFSKIDEQGVIYLARNNPWLNPWNPAIASCLRSNHDISWIPTVAKSLSLIYYITNYATKDDVSPWQMITKAALLKQAIKNATTADPPTATDLRLRAKGMNNFALRCFNSLAQDQEVSGVQVASTLLRLPSYYTVSTQFVRLNLWWLRRYVRAIRNPSDSTSHLGASATMSEEPCTFDIGNTAPRAALDDFAFNPSHPRSNLCTQRIAASRSQIATAIFSGPLTQFQAAEDSIPGGHPKTDAIINDLAEILLGLFTDVESDLDEDDCVFVAHEENFTPETLLAAYYAVTETWNRDLLTTAKRTPIMARIFPEQSPSQPNPIPVNIQRFHSNQPSGLDLLPSTLIETW
ncbi:hypothetical protein BJX62DRAFT_227187 [Aspergillus germanicus]